MPQTKKKRKPAGSSSRTRQGTKTKKNPSSSAKTRAGQSTSRAVKPEPEDHFLDGLILIFLLALSTILLISDFGNGGFLGKALCAVQFGLFGKLSYLFPILLFLGCAFLLSNRTTLLAYKKMLAVLLLYVLLCGFVQLVTDGILPSQAPMDFYAISSDYHTGGGLLGGTVAMTATRAFGQIGGMILLVLAIGICLILIFTRSLVDFLSGLLDLILGPEQEPLEPLQEDQSQQEEMRALRRQLRTQKKQRRKSERRQRRIQELEKALAQENSRREEAIAYEAPSREDSLFVFDPSGTDLKAQGGKGSKTLPEKKKPARSNSTARKTEEEKTETAKQEAFFPSMDFEIHGLGQEEEEPVSDQAISDPHLPAADKEETVKGQTSPQPATQAKDPSPSEDRGSSKKPRSSRKEMESGVQSIEREIVQKPVPEVREYQYPSLDLLVPGSPNALGQSGQELRDTAKKLQEILFSFGVNVSVTDVSCGPTVTRYELQPEPGVKVSRIVNLTDDIKLNLAAADIRIEAPIPGKAAVGIEVPNKESVPVMLRDLLSSQEFRKSKSKITFAVGKDIAGKPVMADIAKMPHLLIAGATGSGKSVCINTLIVSILYKARPEEVQLIMIDPKVVELSVYNGIPHLLIPVVTDPKKASGALNWAVGEMGNRYNTFAEYGVRNISEYNRKLSGMTFPEGEEKPKPMSQIVIIVDELADLMMVAPGEVEDAICRLAQLARAAGIHLVVATQRPSVNVITGLIKANMPSRVAFAVSSGVDSRTILDSYGAEKLLGKGDMLFYPQGYPKPARLQGAFVSDDEIGALVDFLSSQKDPAHTYSKEIEQQVTSCASSSGGGSGEERDPLFAEAGKFIIDKERASIGNLQRLLKIGFNRAARIMDQLAEAGVVGPEEGTKPRKILMTLEQFENYLEE